MDYHMREEKSGYLIVFVLEKKLPQPAAHATQLTWLTSCMLAAVTGVAPSGCHWQLFLKKLYKPSQNN
jgi:hypothetical protein